MIKKKPNRLRFELSGIVHHYNLLIISASLVSLQLLITAPFFSNNFRTNSLFCQGIRKIPLRLLRKFPKMEKEVRNFLPMIH